MMKLPQPTAVTQTAFDRIAGELRDSGAASSAMFGMPTLKAGGKAFAGVFGDALVFKLSGDAHATALALKGAALFDPSGTGRAMKEWVVVPRVHASKWGALARLALAYVHAEPAKPTARKKAARAKR